MDQNLFWFYDVFVVGILIIFLYVGAKKGFIRSIVYAALIIASFVVSWFAAEAFAPLIYDTCIKEQVYEAFSANADETNTAQLVSQAVSDGDYGVEMTEAEISAILEDNPDFFDSLASEMQKNGAQDSSEEIESGVKQSLASKIVDSLFRDVSVSKYVNNAIETISDAGEKVEEIVQAFVSGAKDDAARVVEESLVAPALTWLLKAVIFIVLMFILRFVVNPVSNAFKAVNRIPVVGPVNSLLGALFGIVQGLIFLYVAALAVKAIINISGDSLIFFNTDTVERSKLFIYLYNFDLLSLL